MTDATPTRARHMQHGWSVADNERLIDLRRQGFSYTEIGRQMKRTKGAVSTQARRLNLAALKSPADPVTHTSEPPPEPILRPTRGANSIITAAGSTFRRDEYGRIALHENDRRFAEYLNRRMT